MAEKKPLLPAGQTFSVNGLVDYADGAVVSRTLAETDGGTITMFAFDEGQKLSEHTAPFDAVVNVIDGEIELTIGGAPVSVRTGDLVIMPAGVPHSVTAVKRFKMLLTMLRAADV